jgi:hypothetical protein
MRAQRRIPLLRQLVDCRCAIVPAQGNDLSPPMGSATTGGATAKRNVGHKCHLFLKHYNPATGSDIDSSITSIENPVNFYLKTWQPFRLIVQLQIGNSGGRKGFQLPQ